MQADGESRQQFQQLLQFSGKGTASLFDLTRVWLRRDDLQRAVTRGGVEVTADMLKAREQDLRRLQVVAATVKDPRGRNAADVALVKSLGLLETAQPIQVRQARPPSDGRSTLKPRIIDLTPLRKTGQPADRD